jgi:hypothetical protein
LMVLYEHEEENVWRENLFTDLTNHYFLLP